MLMQHKLITQMIFPKNKYIQKGNRGVGRTPSQRLALLLGRVGAQCTGVLKLYGWGHMELPDFQIEKAEHYQEHR